MYYFATRSGINIAEMNKVAGLHTSQVGYAVAAAETG